MNIDAKPKEDKITIELTYDEAYKLSLLVSAFIDEYDSMFDSNKEFNKKLLEVVK
jgi:hypothetical protein